MKRYAWMVIVIAAALALTWLASAKAPQTVTLKERATASPSGKYVTVLSPSSEPTHPDLFTLYALSTAVVTGTALDNSTELSADGNSISTVYNFRVESVHKNPRGVNLQGQEIRVGLMGGVYAFKTVEGKIVYAEVRTPWFKKMGRDKRYYLFLTGASVMTNANAPYHQYETTGGPQGVFEVANGVVKSHSGRLHDPIWQYHNMSEAEFSGLINQAGGLPPPTPSPPPRPTPTLVPTPLPSPPCITPECKP